MTDTTRIRPEPHPITRFDQPWHAQVFALAVALNEAGLFTWREWTERFGATLARHGLDHELDGGEDYFAAWLETLEALLAARGHAEPGQVAALRDAWEAAYLNTPHGQPVRLAAAVSGPASNRRA